MCLLTGDSLLVADRGASAAGADEEVAHRERRVEPLRVVILAGETDHACFGEDAEAFFPAPHEHLAGPHRGLGDVEGQAVARPSRVGLNQLNRWHAGAHQRPVASLDVTGRPEHDPVFFSLIPDQHALKALATRVPFLSTRFLGDCTAWNR